MRPDENGEGLNRYKYFHESGSRSHYDRRFFKEELDAEYQHLVLVRLLEEFLRVAFAYDAKPILVHGGLLGWFWNRKLLPWDDDIDISLVCSDLEALANAPTALEYDHDSYLFDVNPYSWIRQSQNRHHSEGQEPNRIDARFIDKEFGSFIDITALSRCGESHLATKCPHFYREEDIVPLRLDEFEGLKIYIPSNAAEVLTQEYGAECISNPQHNGYRFNYENELWELGPVTGWSR